MSRRLLPLVLVLSVIAPLRALASDQVVSEERPVEHIHLFFPQDPELTWFIDSWGASRSGGRSHIGVDLMAPKASPVYSIAEGIVTRIGRGTSAGAFIIVNHGSGWESRYMHPDIDEPGSSNGRGGFDTAIAPGLEVGSFVDAGTLIGFVGVSGNARGSDPHTHFELHRDGRAIDPYSILVEAHERALMLVQWTRLAAIVD